MINNLIKVAEKFKDQRVGGCLRRATDKFGGESALSTL
jgi:hypothetical protein